MQRRSSRLLIGLAVLAAIAGGLLGAFLSGGGGAPRIAVPARHGSPPALKLPLGSAVRLDAAQQDKPYLRDFLATFTSLTPENAMKWDETEPRRGHYTLGDADALVDFAQRTGRRVRGHTLVWDQQLPAWLTGGSWSAGELRQVLEDHIRTLVSHWKGKVESWDVVNEPLENDGTLTRSLWLNVLGPGYIATAFRAAHAADPDARLFLNELAAERPGRKQDALYALVKGLKEQGVPIDGVGFQNHTTVGNPPSEAQLAATFARFEALGLDVEITEMDVTIPPHHPTTDRILARQAQAYRDAAAACANASRCTGLTVWGVTDRWSWLGAAKRPTLYDAHAGPKPARDAVLAPLRK